MKTISLIIPTYNEEESLHILYEELCGLTQSLPHYSWEILFVNDGSNDKSASIIDTFVEQDNRVAVVELSRNFGKEAAMLAGFDYVQGDCAIVLDADLQHPISVIPQMIEYWEEGYDDVYVRRRSRGDSTPLRRMLSRCYYSLLQHASNIDVLPDVGDFRLLDRKCIDSLKLLREQCRYTKGMYAWIGFRKKEIVCDLHERIAGKSKWGLGQLLNLAIEGVTSFSVTPLRISSILGFIISLIAFIYMIIVLTKTLIWGDPVAGYPSLMCIILFLGGIQLLSLGIIGEYLGRIFNETKNRPTYIAREYKKRKENQGHSDN
ncbi:MAG: glycosyltransferase family 2 protein [Bacteroidaceae bacterium]|nr:glycosyltransferase family 2 protein [Bacteroidaceae bacterium]